MLNENGNLTLTLAKDEHIVIDGVVFISIATNKNARRNEKVTTVTIKAPKEFRISRSKNIEALK